MFKVNNKKHLNNVNVSASTVDFGLINISWVCGSVILSLLNPLSNFSDKKIYIYLLALRRYQSPATKMREIAQVWQKVFPFVSQQGHRKFKAMCVKAYHASLEQCFEVKESD